MGMVGAPRGESPYCQAPTGDTRSCWALTLADRGPTESCPLSSLPKVTACHRLRLPPVVTTHSICPHRTSGLPLGLGVAGLVRVCSLALENIGAVSS